MGVGRRDSPCRAVLQPAAARGTQASFFTSPWRGEVAARSAAGGGDGLNAFSSVSICLDAAHTTPRPLGATLPLQGRVSNPILATRFLRPSLAKPLHETVASKNKGRRSAERRKR